MDEHNQKSFNKASVPVHSGRRIVGYITADGHFTKTVRGSRHMLRSPQAWCIDVEVFEGVVQPNCHMIDVLDLETETTYSASVKTFDELKTLIKRDAGDQYALGVGFWEMRCES